MKVTVEGGELVIRLPLLRPPAVSSSGKTLVVASTRGNQRSDAVVDGQRVVVGVNADIPRTDR